MKTLNRQVFLALGTIAWADGQLAPEERDGILSAARKAGWSDADLEALQRDLGTPVELSSLDLRKLSALDRVFVYAMGEWLARLDGVVHPDEQKALDALGEFLMLADRVREKALKATIEVAELPSGNRPDRYDLVGLRSMLEERMR
jgi:uncharacterized membrane protein YebE (DUF533 family)